MDSDSGYVYVLHSKKNSRYYIGSTINLDNRLSKHNNGYVKATKNIRPLDLIFSQKYDTIRQARQIEYKLKKLKNNRKNS